MKLKTLLSFFAACLFAMSLNAQNFSNEDVPLFSASGPASANGQAPSKGTSQAKDFTSGPNCPADISTDVNPVSYATPTIDLFETQVSGSVDNSVSATDASADTRHVRIFDLGASGVGAMTINEVIIYQDGFDSNDPTDVVDITIYYAAAGSTPPFDVAGFTSVQTVANVSVGSATPGAMVTIPVSASIPAGVVLAIEIYEPGTNVTNFTVGYTDGASDDGSDTWIALGNPATTTIEPLSDFGLTSQVKIDFNATVEGTQSAGLASGSTFPGCTTTNTFDFMDFDGNTTSCSFDVTITDDVAPVIVCSPDVTFNTNPGLCQGTVDYSISAEDECGSGDLDNPGPLTFNLLTGSLPGSQFNVGTTVVTWEVVDEFGNTDMCSFSVTVIDNELPVILDCTDDITQTADAGVCEAAVSIPVPQINDFASDNCSDLTFTNDYNNGGDASGTYPVGTTTVIWTVADQQGNTVTCSFDVTITDDEAPVIASCASDQDVLTSSDGTGDCAALIPDLTAQVSWTDNCPGATLVQSPAAGDAFAGAHGDTQVVTFTATDAAGNSSVCTTTLTLVDDEDPTIDCSAIVTARDTDPGVCTFTMPGIGFDPTFSDNCSATISNDFNGLSSLAGETFPLGDTDVTWTATDANGNTAQCSITIMVSDNEAPTINDCGPDVTVLTSSNGTGDCTGIIGDYTGSVDWTDNCTGASIVQSPPAGTIFPGANGNTQTITFTITDGSGNTNACSITATLADDEDPIITGCQDITEINDFLQCGRTIDLIGEGYITLNDNCNFTLTSNVDLNSQFFDVGTTNVSFTITDDAGNSAACSFDVTIIDIEFPQLTCPANITVNSAPGNCSATVQWGIPVAFDNCIFLQEFNSNFTSGDEFPVGTTTVVYAATDLAGNVTTCSFDVIVIDVEDPTIFNCPGNITQTADAGECGAIVTWLEPVSTDNCNNEILTSNLSPGAFFPVGTTTVTYIATDDAGNTASCSFDVTITDDENPTIDCSNIDGNRTTDAGVCSFTMPGIGFDPADFADNCPGATITNDYNNSTSLAGETFPLGTTDVTWTVTDAAGNTISCTFTVNVVDDEDPVLDCSNINGNRDADPGVCSFTVPGAGFDPASFSDNCVGATIANDFNGLSSLAGETFPVGSTDIVWTVTDGSGNTASCSITITITDTEAPVVSDCPTDITQDNDAGVCEAVVNWTAPTATDNCTNVATVSTANPGDVFPVGTTTVTYTFTDDSGNTSICSFDVTVEDNEAPVLTDCQTDISVNNDPGICGAVVTFNTPTATDNCGLAGLSGDPIAGFSGPFFFGDNTYYLSNNAENWFDAENTAQSLGGHLVAINDAAENTFVAGLNSNRMWIGLNDLAVEGAFEWTNGDPFIYENWFGGEPNNAGNEDVVEINRQSFGTWNDFKPTSSLLPYVVEFAGVPQPQQTAGLPSGSEFPVGVTTNTFVFTDIYGNSTVCEFTVTVTDNEAPVVSDCPGDISQSNDAGNCSAVVSWTAPSATDNCGITNMSASANPGDTFPVGTTTVTYTWTDAAGNTSICTFDVTVTDDEDPVITGCPADLVVDNAPNVCGNSVSWTAPMASDNCSQMLTSTHNPGDFFPVGTTTVTYTSVDPAGNTATCSFDVTVNDVQAPLIVFCPTVQTFPSDPGTCSADVLLLLTPPTVFENCGAVNVTFDPPGPYVVGSTPVTATVTDGSNNSTTCTFTVSVFDNEDPVFDVCPGDQTFTADPGQCGAQVFFTAPTFSDNCGIANVISSHMPGDFFAAGTTQVVYIITDGAGRSAQCIFNITVEDNENPIIVATAGGPTNGSTFTVTAADGMCEAAVDWIEPGGTDNCGVAFFDADYQPFDIFPVGTTLVTYLASDADGNTAVFTFNVEVLPGNGANCNPNLTITAKVMLEGPYNGTDMDDNLRDGNQIPLNSPYGGPESVSPLVLSADDQVVDWIEVSLRNDPVPGVGTVGEDIVATRAGLLLRDGSIVELDGVSPLTFFNLPAGNYYVAVNHRSHLGLATAAPVAVNGATPMIDFSDPATMTYGGIFDGLTVGDVRLMAGGDVDGDGQVVAADRNAVWNARNTAGYLSEDINMDIVVTAADRALTSNNAFFVEFLP